MFYARDPARLEAVRKSNLLDVGIQESLQRFARLAQDLTGTAVSAVTIIDVARQYFSACAGAELVETPLEASYCKHVAADDVQLAVEDSLQDTVLADNHATQELGIRAYLGSPIRAAGHRLGSFCVLDTEPRRWDERQRRIIEDLAAAVSADIELRIAAEEQRRMAVTDGLTGLGNRRALARALEEVLSSRRPAHLGLLDLDGFKAYNDMFGHPAGDGLLVRLAQRLRAAVGSEGQAFRMGGDEFCVLVFEPESLLAAQASLVDHGPGFQVTASLGSVVLPDEAADTTAAIGRADSRLYAVKHSRPGSLDLQLSAALGVALSERDEDLGDHSDQVAVLARSIAERLGLGTDEIRRVVIAARLHDVGKMAISDRILQKPGPLNDEEWEQMRRHTLIGERIMLAAPVLAGAARLVRSSHERWDGRGYPDGLAGEAIPLGSRIICACDAYDAMTTERPYRKPMSPAEAAEELQRCAGAHFDPRVVEALLHALAGRAQAAA